MKPSHRVSYVIQNEDTVLSNLWGDIAEAGRRVLRTSRTKFWSDKFGGYIYQMTVWTS